MVDGRRRWEQEMRGGGMVGGEQDVKPGSKAAPPLPPEPRSFLAASLKSHFHATATILVQLFVVVYFYIF